MDSRRPVGFSTVALGFGGLAASLFPPPFLADLPEFSQHVIGYSGVTLMILGSLVLLRSGLFGQSPTEGSVEPPLEIIFDKTNPDRRFWSLEVVTDESGKAQQPITQYWEYRVAIKNASSKTVRNVSVTTDWVNRVPGLASVPHDQLFKRRKTKTVDLKPQCEELVPIHTWPHPRIRPGMFAGESILWYGKLKVLASGEDVLPTERYFKFNYERDPMLFDWVDRS